MHTYKCTQCGKGITEERAEEADSLCLGCGEPEEFRVEGDGWDDGDKHTKEGAEKVVLNFALNELDAEDIHVFQDGDDDEWDVILTVEIRERGTTCSGCGFEPGTGMVHWNRCPNKPKVEDTSLMDAAPMLLEAVDLFLNNPGSDLAQHQQAVGHMKAAVAKARGES